MQMFLGIGKAKKRVYVNHSNGVTMFGMHLRQVSVFFSIVRISVSQFIAL